MTLSLPDFKKRLQDASYYTDKYDDEFYEYIENRFIADMLLFIKNNNHSIDLTPATILECTLFFGYGLQVDGSEVNDSVTIKILVGDIKFLCAFNISNCQFKKEVK